MAKIISKETLMVGIVAVLAGLAAAYGLRVYMSRPEPIAMPARPPLPTKRMPVASEDLPADRVIATGDIVSLPPMTNQEILKRFKIPAGEQVLTDGKSILRRRLKNPVKKGQPFVTTDFYLEGVGPSIAEKLQPGFRAIRIEVPDTHDAGAQAGTFVDVLFRANASKAAGGQPAIPETTKTLMRHVEVLVVEQPAGKLGPKGEAVGAARKKSILVTLAVPEDKADVFSVVEGRGELWLVPTPLKESPEAGSAASKSLTLAGLLGIKAPPPPKRSQPVPPPFETAIYRGDRIQVNQFADGKLLARHASRPGPVTSDNSTPSIPEDVPAPPAPQAE